MELKKISDQNEGKICLQSREFNEKSTVLFTLTKNHIFTLKNLILFTLPFILSLSLKLKVFKSFSLVFLTINGEDRNCP